MLTFFHDSFRLLRPSQWLKNLMLFFPPFLGGEMFQAGMLQKGLVPFVSFCLVSSSTYIFNDILDSENDALHPRKKNRPIASGQISLLSAKTLAILLLLLGSATGWFVSILFFSCLLFYLSVSVSYSIKLKNIPLVDIFCISIGFLIRLEAGGAVYNIKISEWLFLTVFLLSIFLSTGKRLSEKNMLESEAISHRKSLEGYPEGFLEGVMYMTGAAVLVTYTLYVIQKPTLVYTVPLCAFGLMRYLLLVNRGKTGDPTHALLRDGVLFAVSLLWVLVVGAGIYFR